MTGVTRNGWLIEHDPHLPSIIAWVATSLDHETTLTASSEQDVLEEVDLFLGSIQPTPVWRARRLTDGQVEDACHTLSGAIEAARNSNHAGEQFVVSAAAVNDIKRELQQALDEVAVWKRAASDRTKQLVAAHVDNRRLDAELCAARSTPA